MGNLTQHQIENISFDEGLVYLNYGTPSEIMLGPLRGGAEFVANTKIRDIDFDGRKGKTKGMQVIEEVDASLKITTLLCDNDTLKLALPGATIENDVLQIDTATVIGTIATAGNAKVIVTAEGVTGSPLAFDVAVALSDTATLVAGKIRTALSGNTALTDIYTVGGTGANITLTRKVAAQNDSSLNILITNGTCVGLTTITESATTVKGAISKIKSPDVGLIPASDYIENVTVFAKLMSGKFKKISIYNAMHEGDMKYAAKPKGENEHGLEFFAHHEGIDNTKDIFDIEDIDTIGA